jgi:hypothetical protein
VAAHSGFLTRVCGAAIAAALAWGPAPAARADVEGWAWFEARVPISDGQYGLPNSWRVWTDTRLGGRYPGLGQQFVRMGPIWELHPNMFLATHLTSYADQVSPGVFEQEVRAEFEPNLRARWGLFNVADRNRLEYRFGRPSAPRWRYRNLLRVNIQPEGATLYPYVADEVLVDLSGAGFNQNRSYVGLSKVLSDSTRVDVAYLLRARATAAGPWALDHILNLVLFFAPRTAPMFPASAPADD